MASSAFSVVTVTVPESMYFSSEPGSNVPAAICMA